MRYDSTIGPDWVWDLNKAVYLHQLCESLPPKARSTEFANPMYDLVPDKYQNQDTAMVSQHKENSKVYLTVK